MTVECGISLTGKKMSQKSIKVWINVPIRVKFANVAASDQDDTQNVMCQHLIVVRPAFLSVDDVDLVQPPSELGEVVEFGESRQVSDGVRAPEGLGG